MRTFGLSTLESLERVPFRFRPSVFFFLVSSISFYFASFLNSLKISSDASQMFFDLLESQSSFSYASRILQQDLMKASVHFSGSFKMIQSFETYLDSTSRWCSPFTSMIVFKVLISIKALEALKLALKASQVFSNALANRNLQRLPQLLINLYNIALKHFPSFVLMSLLNYLS